MSRPHRIEIPAGSPFFQGHFPGHPILPGVAQLCLVQQALSEERGESVWIAEIPALKLRSPVRPGDDLDLTWSDPDDDTIVRFSLRRAEEVVSTGSLRLGAAGESPVPDLPALDPYPAASASPVASLVPHAPPARLIRDILAASATELTGLAEIPAGSPFVAGGRAPSFLGLEAAAQGAAILEALSRRDAPGARIGYLVGLRNVRCRVPWLPVESPFLVTLRLSGSASSLSIYEVTGGQQGGLFQGTISTFVPSCD
jgi:3-hydroxyacyl-[acyl-carrier-protein] dehydratase